MSNTWLENKITKAAIQAESTVSYNAWRAIFGQKQPVELAPIKRSPNCIGRILTNYLKYVFRA